MEKGGEELARQIPCGANPGGQRHHRKSSPEEQRSQAEPAPAAVGWAQLAPGASPLLILCREGRSNPVFPREEPGIHSPPRKLPFR